MNPIKWSMNHSSKSIEKAIEEVGLMFVGEKEIGEFFEEDEELKLERKREVLLEKGREKKVEERREWIERNPFVATKTTELKVVDEGFPIKRRERLQWWLLRHGWSETDINLPDCEAEAEGSDCQYSILNSSGRKCLIFEIYPTGPKCS